jgi:hypothetical protein
MYPEETRGKKENTGSLGNKGGKKKRNADLLRKCKIKLCGVPQIHCSKT